MYWEKRLCRSISCPNDTTNLKNKSFKQIFFSNCDEILSSLFDLQKRLVKTLFGGVITNNVVSLVSALICQIFLRCNLFLHETSLICLFTTVTRIMFIHN